MRESTFDKVRGIGIVVGMVSLFLPVLTTTVHWYATSDFPTQTSNDTIFLISSIFSSPSPIGPGQ
jgi:hypothetical protein